MSCPFCNSAVLKNEEIFSSEEWRLIYNLKPFMEGHCLLVPKRHIERFEELIDSECAEFHGVVKKTFELFKRAYQATAFTLILQNGKAAGQSIPHLHYHLTPRREGDVDHAELYQSIMLESEQRKPLSEENMASIVNGLRTQIPKY